MEKRKLGYIESRGAHIFEKGRQTGTIVTSANIEGEVDEDTMIDALEAMFERHPLAQSVIIEEDGDYFFEQSAQFDDIYIEFSDNKKSLFNQVFAREMSGVIDQGRALWRCTILLDHTKRKKKHHTLILTTHPSISDGVSSAMFVHDLMTIYEKLQENSEYQPEPLPFIDPVEELANSNKSVDEFHRETEEVRSFRGDGLPFAKDVAADKRQTRVRYIDFCEEELDAIHRASREHKVSVNATLNAAMLMAYADIFKKAVKVRARTPVNMRKHSIPEIGREFFGLFISLAESLFDVSTSGEGIFDLARRYQETVDRAMSSEIYMPNKIGMTTRELFDKLGDCTGAGEGEFSGTVSLANMNQFPFRTELKRHKIEKFYFTTCRNGADLPIAIHTITVNGMMCTSLSWSHPNMSDDVAHEFTDRYISHLEKGCDFTHSDGMEKRKAS